MTRGRVLALVVVLVALAAAIQWVVGRIDVAAQKSLVEARLSEAFGRPARIEGEFRLSAWPRPHLTVGDLHVANPEGSPSPDLLRVGELAFGFELWPLLSGVIELDHVQIRNAELHIEPDGTRPVLEAPELHSLAELPEPETGSTLRVELESVDVRELRAFYRDPESGVVRAAVLERLVLESPDPGDPLELHARGTLEGGSFDLSGRLGPITALLDARAPYPFRIAGRVFESRVEVDGRVEDVRTLHGLDMQVRAALPELANLAAFWADDLPDLGPASFEGRIHERDGALGIDGLRLAPQGGPVRGALTGAVRDLSDFHGVDLELRVESDDLSRLGPVARVTAPAGSAGRLSATLSDRERPLSLDLDGLVRTADGSLVLEGRGRHADVSRMHGLDVDLKLHVAKLSALRELLDPDAPLPELGPVDATGKLHAAEGVLGVRDIAIHFGNEGGLQAQAHGAVDELVALRGVRLEVRASAPDATQLGRILGRELPRVGALRAELDVSDGDGTLGVDTVEIHTGTGAVSLDLSGSLDDLRARDGVELTAELRADDLTSIGKIFGADLPSVAPVMFRGRISGDDEAISSSGWTRLDRTEFSGTWTAQLATRRPSVEAELHSPHVHLDDLGVAPDVAPVPVRPQAEKLFRDAGWLDALRAVDLDFGLRADRVTGAAGLELSGVVLKAVLDDGLLQAGITESEGATVTLRIDSRTPEPSFELAAEGGDIDIAKLASQVDAESESAGRLEAAVQLQGHGGSWRAVRSSVAGRVWVRIHEWAVAGRMSREFVRNLTLAFLPERDPPALQRLGCFVGDAALGQGVANVEKLIFDGGNVIVTGSGKVDLVSQTLDLRLVPTVRDPKLLSISPTVDVTGPLLDPQFKPVRRTLATSAARALIGRALEPANALLRPLTGRERSVPGACEEPPPTLTSRGIDYMRSLTGGMRDLGTGMIRRLKR